MGNTNASASAFGWQFQVNSAILLMLENIKSAKKIRVEGKNEDIEIVLEDGKKIYAQVKSVVRPDDYTNVIKKFSKALETLNAASKNGDGVLFSYITNSPNPFNRENTMSFFMGRTHLFFEELPNVVKEDINSLIQKKKIESFNLDRFDIRVIPFYGTDYTNRNKEILACVNEFLGKIDVNYPGIGGDVMDIWYGMFFHNSTQMDLSISIEKEKMIWPLIVLVLKKTSSYEYKNDFYEEDIQDIEYKYGLIINQNVLKYDIISRIYSDYIISRTTPKEFINNCYSDYIDIVNDISADYLTKSALIKIIMHRILSNRSCINNIKREVHL